MAEVICPSCGKENPAESTFCWFCQARLNSAPPAKHNSGALRAEDTPDWLKTMRDKGDISGRVDEGNLDDLGAAGGPEGQPEWLARLRERKNAEEKLARMSGGEDAEEETDWLKKISSDTSAFHAANGEEEVPSWMQPENPATASEEEEVPAWMQPEPAKPSEPTIEIPNFPPLEPASGAEPTEEIPEWMRGEPEKPVEQPIVIPSFQPSESEPQTEATIDLPDWMKGETEKPAEQPVEIPTIQPAESEPQAEATIDLPDWMKGEAEKPAESGENQPSFDLSQPDSKPVPTDDVPNWMHPEVPGSISSEPVAEDAQPQVETPAEENGLPAWMNAMATSQVPEAPASEAGTPDWLNFQPGDESKQPVEQTPVEEPSDQGGTPKWLSHQPFDQADQPNEQAPEGQPPAQAGTPDWLNVESSAQPKQPEEHVAAEQPPSITGAGRKSPESGDDTPDWLNDLANWKPDGIKFEETAEPQSPSFTPEETPEIPAFSFDTPVEETSQAKPQPSEEEPLPDFLSGTGFTPIEPTQSEPAFKEETPLESFTLPDIPIETPPAPPTPSPEPDWLRELEATPATPFDANTPPVEAGEAATADSLPDWLANVQADFSAPTENDQPGNIFVDEKAGEEKAAETNPFAGDEMPDWLSLTSNQEAGGDLGDKVAAFGLEPAQLPGWLEAMKPTESGTANLSSEEIDHITEQRGPLAGMDGVLPLEDLSGVYSRPPVYSTRLLISERQRAHTTLLESVLLEETTPTALPMKPALAPLKLARIFIGILLILMLLFPLVTNSHFMLLPALYPPETVALYDAIQNMADNSPVLLVVDYEPGLSGEVSLSAEQVVRHLMSRNARLTIISTIPTGPAQAQELLARSAAVQTAYDLTNQVVNLGYLAGGTTGLQEFVQNPQAAAGYTLDLQPAWSQPALAGITSLNQFSSVIVLTDNQEVSRSWIEQVQPALTGTPLFMVASAQAAPLIQPYVDSGQVQGLLSGLMGSAVYEQIMLQPGNATQYWDAYQYGIVAAIILTLAGVLLQIVTFLRRQGKPQSGA
jgi:hypothetical protein